MRRPRLLIIDDSASFRKLLAHDLDKRGYAVIEAGNGPEGLAAFSTHKPDGVLIDLRMPEMDGMAVLKKLAGHCSEAPLIVISGEGEIEDAIMALRSGAWDYVVKGDGFSESLAQSLTKAFERAAFLRSQRQQFEAEIEERRLAENRFRTLLDVSPLPIVIIDLDNGTCVFANQRASEHFGVSPEEVEGLVTKPFYTGESVRKDIAERILREGNIENVELKLCRRDGTCFWTQASASLMELDGRRTAYISFSDVTARKELAESLQKFKFIANATHDLMTLASRDFIYEAANRAYLDYHGIEEKSLVGRSMADVWGKDNFERNILPRVQGCLEGEIVSYEAWFPFPGKPSRYYEVFMYPYVDPNGRVTHIATVSKDITEAAEAQAQILESREHFRAIFESSLDPILLLDHDLNILDLNTAAIIKFGFHRSEVEGKSLKILNASDEDYEAFRKTVLRQLAGTGAWVGEWSFVDKKGARIPTETAFSQLSSQTAEATVGYVAVVRDISRRLQAERARQESEKRYRAVFESSGSAMILVNEDGVVTRANRRFAELFGLNQRDIEGNLNWLEFVHLDERESMAQCRENRLNDASSPTSCHEFRFLTSDGRHRHVHLEAGLLPGSRDSIVSLLDITERKYNETVARMLFRISSVVSAASDTEDLYGRVNEILSDNLSASNFFVALLDKTNRYLEFVHFRDEMDNFTGAVIDTKDSDVASLSVEVLRIGRPLLVTTSPISDDEREELEQQGAVWMSRWSFLASKGITEEGMIGTMSQGWLGVPLRIHGEVAGVMAVQSYSDPFRYTVRDVKLMVAVSEQLSLAIEHREMHRELVLAMRRAEAANESKNEFLANMSHEVRTPLNGVLGMLQLAQTTDLTVEQRDYVDTALMSGRSLLSIINDILDFSKIEAGRMEIVTEPFSLQRLVMDVLATFRGEGKRHVTLSSDIDADLPEMVVGAKGRLRQILFNLVGNSVKFTEEGSVTVSVHSLGRDELSGFVRVLISVEDTGIGIPESKIAQVFEPFTQVDGSYVRRHQGTGLGLGIVKRLVHLMGGTLEIDTLEGEGTSIHITMEFAVDPSSMRFAAEFVPSLVDRGPLHVLVVEDNRVNRLLAARMLDKLGQSVETAADAMEALEKLETTKFDVVFLDIQMPGMDGVELTRTIRNPRPGSSIDPAIRIIAMTAHAMDGDREHFLSKGMDDYIAKPVEMDDIRRVLASQPSDEF